MSSEITNLRDRLLAHGLRITEDRALATELQTRLSVGAFKKALDEGSCVGLVPDGIAGIFRCTAEDEVVVLKKRKGIAKLALRTGHPIVPAYSIGNTAAFSAEQFLP